MISRQSKRGDDSVSSMDLSQFCQGFVILIVQLDTTTISMKDMNVELFTIRDLRFILIFHVSHHVSFNCKIFEA